MQKKLTPFPCDSCGKCCRKVNMSEQTLFLDRGDGVCRHFSEESNLCSIYEDRPIVCRVEDYYKKYLASQVGWDDFVKINVQICDSLKNT